MIRTRIAPSPTGPLHIGTARSALFNFIFAKQQKGKFILRVEDTDLERSDPVFERNIKEGLIWLGLEWDEFYRQSDRLDLYEKYLKKLFNAGAVFWCPHSEGELAQERKEQILRKEPLLHFCPFRDGSSEEGRGILRFKNDFDGTVEFDDMVRGKIKFEAKLLGDFSVAKNFTAPLYNFAVVTDDHDMKISHVIRGEDHISNTPKQIILASALGFSLPKYAHLPLILGTDRSKLSKRHGALSVLEYKKMGYLVEAMLNFMALLGWHPAPTSKAEEKEIFTMEELLKEFSLERVQKAGAVFDINKLKWLNGEHIKNLETKDLAPRLKAFLPHDLLKQVNAEPEKWMKITELLRDRLTTLNEAGDMAEYFYKDVYYPREMLFWKNNQSNEDIVRHLKHLKTILSNASKWGDRKDLEGLIMPYAKQKGTGDVLWPFRVALSGRNASAGPFEIAEILGKEETLLRVEKAIKMFE